MITKAERAFIEKAIEGKSPLVQKEMAEQLIDYFTRKKMQPRQHQDFTPIDWKEVLPGLIGRDFG